MKVKSA